MTLIRWNPWSDLTALHGQMDSLFNQVFSEESGVRPGNGGYTNLPVDIRQTDDAYIIDASVPGFEPEEVEVTFDDGLLTIRGSHQEERGEESGEYIRRERRARDVHRQVGLPAEVRPDDITAAYDKGVLTITVPRAQKAQPKRIQVSAGSRGKRVVEAGRS